MGCRLTSSWTATRTSNALRDFDVVAVDTDSRAASAEAAYLRVAEAAALVKRTSASFFKSMDSTLRGNLGAEVDAVMDVIAFDLAAVAPAFPLYGRTTVAGIHYLHGQRIDATEFASDPQSPVKDADVLRVFAAQSKRTVGHVALDSVRQGRGAICSRAMQTPGERGRARRLRRTDRGGPGPDRVRGGGQRPPRALGRLDWAGGASLADPCGDETPDQHARQAGARTGAPTLSVVGSASQVTREQVATFLRRPGVSSVRMDPFRIIAAGEPRDQEIDRCSAQVLAELREGNDVVLDVASSREDIAATQDLGRQSGLDGSQVGVEGRRVAGADHPVGSRRASRWPA